MKESNLLPFLFGFSGRLSRLGLCRGAALISGAWFLLGLIIVGCKLALGASDASATIGSSVLIPMIPIAVRRLHDRNKSGWWIAALALFLVFLQVAPNQTTAFAIVSGFILLWALVELFVLPGTPGPNRYGA